ncbi:MAG: hypothetical protein JXB18_10910 [Sedimentisphaerales bacterium]|nr:hypothetical protein [Sedimentisphaerales bacterium]
MLNAMGLNMDMFAGNGYPGGWNGGITALFDKEGNALPAMKYFKEPSASK